MLIIGTGGFAADLLTSLTLEYRDDELVFYNDTDIPDPELVTKYFTVLKTAADAANYFRSTDKRFIVAVGDNHGREMLAKRFTEMGGVNPSFVSKYTRYGRSTQIAPNGVIIMHDTNISWDAKIDEGSLVYLGCGLGHGSRLGRYCFLSSGVIMSKVTLGDYCTVNIGVNFRPGETLGANSFVGIGAVVTKSFPENSTIWGNPAK